VLRVQPRYDHEMSQQEVPKLAAIEGGRAIAARGVQAELAKRTEELSFVVHRTREAQ